MPPSSATAISGHILGTTFPPLPHSARRSGRLANEVFSQKVSKKENTLLTHLLLSCKHGWLYSDTHSWLFLFIQGPQHGQQGAVLSFHRVPLWVVGSVFFLKFKMPVYFCNLLNSWFSNSLHWSWWILVGKPNFREKSLKILSAAVLPDLLWVGVGLCKLSKVINDYQNVLIPSPAFFSRWR